VRIFAGRRETEIPKQGREASKVEDPLAGNAVRNFDLYRALQLLAKIRKACGVKSSVGDARMWGGSV
jgi:hypothetical protein